MHLICGRGTSWEGDDVTGSDHGEDVRMLGAQGTREGRPIARVAELTGLATFLRWTSCPIC